jgi:hypothetical protein
MNIHTATELDETTRHRLLADEQRRFVIGTLQTARSGVETTLDELARHVEKAAQRTDGTEGTDFRSLRCRLHHVHLPMLAEAGLLEYDPTTKRVRLGQPWPVTATAGPT